MRAVGPYVIDLFGRRWGFERSPITHENALYMRRWILYLFGYTLRLHCIHRADKARALHDHPFWFVTFPLGAYREMYWVPENSAQWAHVRSRTVRPWRLHFRGVEFRHRICHIDRPAWTIVLSGPYQRRWGFWPKPDEFVPWREYE